MCMIKYHKETFFTKGENDKLISQIVNQVFLLNKKRLLFKKIFIYDNYPECTFWRGKAMDGGSAVI